MLKKTITYENLFTSQTVTEDHYFHISKADLVQMDMEEYGTNYVKDGETLTGMQAKLQKIVDSQDGKALIAELRDIIRRSYGKKDGDRFIKTPEIWADFSSTEAYSQLLFDLCTDAAQAAEFINGIIPPNLEKVAAEIQEKARQTVSTNGESSAIAAYEDAAAKLGGGETPKTRAEEIAEARPDNPVTLTTVEIVEMDSDELKSGLAVGKYKLS